jgi:hypothetical protein
MTKTTSLLGFEIAQSKTTRCVCGRMISRGRLCGDCFSSVPDFIREQYLAGTNAQRENATRWIKARASHVSTLELAA